jgi:hypothetical protein
VRLFGGGKKDKDYKLTEGMNYVAVKASCCDVRVNCRGKPYRKVRTRGEAAATQRKEEFHLQ